MKNWKNILSRLKYWREKEKRWQKAVNEFCKVIAHTSYAPFIETEFVEAYINGVAEGNHSLSHDLEYYIYEAPDMKSAIVSIEGKSWNMKKDDEAIEYFNKFYP